jgi:outer membrane protein assembly factor BamB
MRRGLVLGWLALVVSAVVMGCSDDGRAQRAGGSGGGGAQAAAAVTPPKPVPVGTWANWRGPEQNGVSREKDLPTDWDPEAGTNVLWKANAGGMSSPIVMNGKVYTLTRTGEEERPDTVVAGPKTQEVVACFDADTGKPVWDYKMNMTQTEVPFHRLGWSNPLGDPGTGRVYALGAQCNLLCFDGNDGKVIWQRQMTEEFGMISTFGGRTPTPSLDEDQVFIGGVAFGWGDNARAQYRIFAFDKNSGELNWTNGTGGLPVDSPYQTATITVIDGQKQLVTGAGDGSVCGFQARTGKLIWKYQPSKRGINASVLVSGSRFFVCSGEVNYDNSASGTVRCIDVAGAKPKEIWRKDGVEAGFSSPTLADGKLYVCDNSATVFCFKADDGKELWRKRCGTIGKASLTYGDGKLFVPEANGKVWILDVTGEKPKVLSQKRLESKPGREYVIFGSVAISNGRVYLASADTLYCIGPKEAHTSQEMVPAPPAESTAGDRAPAHVQVRPADVVMHPGQKKQFALKLFDAMGRPAGGDAKTQWSIGQLTLPPPPAPPTTIPAGTGGGAAGGAPAPAAAAALQPAAPTAPTKVGNLKGKVADDGTFTADAGPHQCGGVFAKVGNLTGFTRVRVLPPLPWKFDFEQVPVGVPPLTWLGAGGKFSVQELEGNKVLDKVPTVDLYYRARSNFGTPDMANYTLQADVRAGEKQVNGQYYIPDPGVINQRYVLTLYGNHQFAEIHVWAGALPTVLSGSAALNKRVPFQWQPNKWYRMKLRVEQLPDKALARGKIWPADGKEPENWTIVLEDAMPNRSGNPGLFGHSLVTPFKSDLYYDNILVTPNDAAGGARIGAAN